MALKNLATSSTRYCTSFLKSSRSPSCWRLFTTSHRLSADEPPKQPDQPLPAIGTTPSITTTQRENALNTLGSIGTNLGGSAAKSSQYGLGFTNLADKYAQGYDRYGDDEYHLHVSSTKRNTHLTFSNPERNSIISISTGNLGFRKSQRGTYDAAYQLMAYLLTRLQQQGLLAKINKMELVLRGFGQGRDAVTKVLMGTEGTRLRDAIVRVVDKTKIKIGGPRSPKPRRLG